jgi:hypothetical protein
MSASRVNLDYGRMNLRVSLPQLGGADPPPACPVCGSSQIPPESDAGLPPLEEPTYSCDASYNLAEDKIAPDGWEPCKSCCDVRTRPALAWLRERCAADPSSVGVAAVLTPTLPEAPPYRVENGPTLEVTLPATQGERAYDNCPICGSPTSKFSEHAHRYSCGASYWSTSLRPGPGGKMTPMTWAGRGSCRRASITTILRVLRARNEPEWEAVCEEALAALPKA